MAGANLAGTDLNGLTLRLVDFTGADLTGANFQDADLSAVVLDHALLREADLQVATFAYCHMKGTDLHRASCGSGRDPISWTGYVKSPQNTLRHQRSQKVVQALVGGRVRQSADTWMPTSAPP